MLPGILAAKYNVPFQFGGTALLIVVGVALDTVQQIESHLITRHYEGFTGSRGPRIRGRRERQRRIAARVPTGAWRHGLIPKGGESPT